MNTDGSADSPAVSIGNGGRKAALERLEAELDAELLDRLVAYADKKAGWLFWQGMIGAPMPEGLEPEDVVAEAVKKTIRGVVEGPGRGRRVWSGKADLYAHLKSVVDSDLNHAAESWVNRHFRAASLLDGAAENDDEGRSGVLERNGGLPNPEEELIQREIEEASDRFFWGFREYVEEPLRPVLDRIYEGDTKPSEVAEALEEPVEKVYNARKQLRRRLADFQKLEEEKRRSQNGK